MRNPNRLDKLYEITRDLHKENIPDWRFFQFMSNIMGWIYAEKKIDPFFLEDDKALKYIQEYLKKEK